MNVPLVEVSSEPFAFPVCRKTADLLPPVMHHFLADGGRAPLDAASWQKACEESWPGQAELKALIAEHQWADRCAHVMQLCLHRQWALFQHVFAVLPADWHGWQSLVATLGAEAAESEPLTAVVLVARFEAMTAALLEHHLWQQEWAKELW